MLLFAVLGVTRMVTAQPDKVYTRLTEIKDPLQVYQLELNYKRYKKIPPVVFECTNLRRLDLSKNFIDTLPPEIGTLTQLQELNLNRNRLAHVPAALGQLQQLRRLNLSRNPLMELPEEVGTLSQLEELVLWMTGIVEFPPTFVALNATLRRLDMRACPLTYDHQQAIEELLPGVEKRWDYVCNCH